MPTYCVIPNHWHELLWAEHDGDLARFMQRLTINHVRHWQEYRHYVDWKAACPSQQPGLGYRLLKSERAHHRFCASWP